MKNLFFLFVVSLWVSFSGFVPVSGSKPLIETIATKEQIVYVTKTGKKYHKGSCRYLKNSKKEIEKSKAKESGYTACAVCKP
ncbi:hypothetical protein [Paenimyroides viscosum]|uniref:Nuclease n=1 Tax=Paenimyroides viscosum TaxID=2488729 RepID=A0A3P1ANC5_9FLAO|nr:hypothetical protein [Paenimyroides viscosum]RRA90395.1 hypothetical protein EG242_13575 [Paenimyroides viscosum]